MATEPLQPDILVELRARANLAGQFLYVARNSAKTVQAAFISDTSNPHYCEVEIAVWDCMGGERVLSPTDFVTWFRTTLAGNFATEEAWRQRDAPAKLYKPYRVVGVPKMAALSPFPLRRSAR